MKARTVIALVFGAGVGASAALLPQWHSIDAQAAPKVTTSALPELVPLSYDPSVSLAPLVDTYGPAVVFIEVEQKVKVEAPNLGPWQYFFNGDPHGLGQQQQEEGGNERFQTRKGAGSGFFISKDGYILTNNHVVDGADEVTVHTTDEQELKAKVIGTDPRTDIALVKVEASHDMPFVKLGSSEHMRVGDWVVAIGNPFGLANSVTVGIVSAKGRVIGAGPYDDFIQTDASINPGNSGGPLFNLAGEVIGINTAINASGQGIGFAVPSDMITPVLAELKENGTVARGWIGVGLQEMDADLAEQLHVEQGNGVVVSQVFPGTPGYAAGLQAGDVVTSLDGEAVKASDQLVRSVGARRPGQTIKLGLVRDGKPMDLKVTLAERCPEEDLRNGSCGDSKEHHSDLPAPKEASSGAYGFSVRDAPQLNGAGSSGIVVTEVDEDSPAADRLQPGDQILQAEGQEVQSALQLRELIKKDRDGLLLVVKRNNAQVLVAVPRKE